MFDFVLNAPLILVLQAVQSQKYVISDYLYFLIRFGFNFAVTQFSSEWSEISVYEWFQWVLWVQLLNINIFPALNCSSVRQENSIAVVSAIFSELKSSREYEERNSLFDNDGKKSRVSSMFWRVFKCLFTLQLFINCSESNI